MTRECKADFVELKKFIEHYRISKYLENAAYLESLKNMHKVYFSMVNWNAEMEHRRKDFLLLYNDSSVGIVRRISESVSDMGASLFNWMNGSNKTARVMMRSAIENFIRSISAIDNKSQLTEKNVYSMFEKAGGSAMLNSKPAIKKSYMQLHSDYKTLCKDTHTTTFTNMEQLSSLAGLPGFTKNKAETSKEIYVRIAKNISGIYCLVFSEFFHSMHHRNKENILHSLAKEIRPIVAGLEALLP